MCRKAEVAGIGKMQQRNSVSTKHGSLMILTKFPNLWHNWEKENAKSYVAYFILT